MPTCNPVCRKVFIQQVKAATPPTTGLYACYPCNEADGATALVDKVSAFNLFAVGLNVISVPGKIGTAIRIGFVPPNHWCYFYSPNIAWDSHWDLSAGSFTVRLWINFTPGTFVNDEAILLALEKADTSGAHLVYKHSDGKIYFRVDLGGSTIEASAAFTSSAWHRIVVWHEKGVGLGLKIDDNASVTTANVNAQSAGPRLLFVGVGTGEESYASLDDLAIWNKKLTNAEMTTDWNSGSGQSCSPACYGSIPLSPTLTLDAGLLAAINADIPDPHFTGTWTLVPGGFGCILYTMSDPLSGHNVGFIDDYSLPTTFELSINWGWNGFVFTRGLVAVKVPSSKTVPAGNYQIVFLTPNPLSGYSIGSLITVT